MSTNNNSLEDFFNNAVTSGKTQSTPQPPQPAPQPPQPAPQPPQPAPQPPQPQMQSIPPQLQPQYMIAPQQPQSASMKKRVYRVLMILAFALVAFGGFKLWKRWCASRENKQSPPLLRPVDGAFPHPPPPTSSTDSSLRPAAPDASGASGASGASAVPAPASTASQQVPAFREESSAQPENSQDPNFTPLK